MGWEHGAEPRTSHFLSLNNANITLVLNSLIFQISKLQQFVLEVRKRDVSTYLVRRDMNNWVSLCACKHHNQTRIKTHNRDTQVHMNAVNVCIIIDSIFSWTGIRYIFTAILLLLPRRSPETLCLCWTSLCWLICKHSQKKVFHCVLLSAVNNHCGVMS